MMSMQARDSFVPHFGSAHGLRAYPHDSPRAKARLIVLALLADGQLDKREFDCLERQGIYAALGMSREDFVEVLLEFCNDVARLPQREGKYLLASGLLDGLFAEIDDPAERRRLMRHIFETICSDGKLAAGEEHMFWKAIDAWQLRISDMPEKPRATAR
jgi:uncharacterized tellurite resistance protein B-like protein